MHFINIFILTISLACLPLFSNGDDGRQDEEKEEAVDLSKVSEAFGHLIGKNIDTLGIKFDLRAVIKGLQDASDGKFPPMSEAECIQAISTAQETAFKIQAHDNLKKAEDFLKKNSVTDKVISLEEGKVQYKIEKEGFGPAIKEHFSPLIRYVGKYLDGSTFGSSKEDEMISLDETIAGFSKGLLGMKEGEKRTLYIHPDYGYGTSGYLPPNSLLTFEVELVKANSPMAAEEQNNLSLTPSSRLNNEIAGSEHEVKAMR